MILCLEQLLFGTILYSFFTFLKQLNELEDKGFHREITRCKLSFKSKENQNKFYEGL